MFLFNVQFGFTNHFCVHSKPPVTDDIRFCSKDKISSKIVQTTNFDRASNSFCIQIAIKKKGNTLVLLCHTVSKVELLDTQYEAEKTKHHIKSSSKSMRHNVRPFKSLVSCRVTWALNSGNREL
jgi:hypothetical protein